MSKSIDVQVSGPNALRIENEREDIRAGGYSSVGNRADDTSSKGIVSVFGFGFSEELPGAATLDIRPFHYDVSYPVLVGQNTVK